MDFSDAQRESARQRRRKRAEADRDRAARTFKRLSASEIARALWCDEAALLRSTEPPPSPGNRGHQRSPAAWSREDIPRFWDKPEVRRQREHRIDQPTDEDRDYTLLEVFKHCTHHRIVCYDDNWEGDEFAYGVFSILWEAETNLVVLFGRNGSGKSLVVKEFSDTLSGEERLAEYAVQIRAELHADPRVIEEALSELTLGLTAEESNFVGGVCGEMFRMPAFLWDNSCASPVIARTAATRSHILGVGPSAITNQWVDNLYNSAIDRFNPPYKYACLDDDESNPRLSIPEGQFDTEFEPLELWDRSGVLDARLTLRPKVWRFDGHRTDIAAKLGISVQDVVLGESEWEDSTTYKPPVPDSLRNVLPDVQNGTGFEPSTSYSFDWINKHGHPASPGGAVTLRVLVRKKDTPDRFLDIPVDDPATLQQILTALLAGGPGRYSQYARHLIPVLEALVGGSQPTESARSIWHSMGTELAFRASVLLKLTEIIANQTAPAFVTDYARLVLQPPTPNNPQLIANLITAYGRIEELDEAPSGIGRWIRLVLGVSHEEAIDRWKVADAAQFQEVRDDDNPWDEKSVWAVAYLLSEQPAPPPTQPVVVLADEPELNLHPEAAEEAATWIATLAQDRTVLVATHSPAFLNLPPSKAALVGLRRHEQAGLIEPFSIGTDAMERLDALGDELGLGRNAFLHLTRGVVIVEGRADQAALNALAPKLISRNRLIVVVLHGSSNARRFAEAEVIQKLGIPLALLLDNTSQDRLKRLEEGDDSHATQETRTQLRLKEIAQSTGLPLTLLNFDAPDIIAAVPDAVIHRQIGGRSQWSWGHCLARWGNESSQGTIGRLNFKDWVLDQWGCSRKAGGAEVITSLFQETLATDEPPRVAVRFMKELEAWADSLGHSGPHQG